jgi:hypothetical protein
MPADKKIKNGNLFSYPSFPNMVNICIDFFLGRIIFSIFYFWNFSKKNLGKGFQKKGVKKGGNFPRSDL